jgi:plastocyanin
MKRLTSIFLFALVATSGYACSSDDTTPTPFAGPDGGALADGAAGGDAGKVNDAGAQGDSNAVTDSAVDSAVPAPCTDAELDAPAANFTGADAGGQGAGGADISFPTGALPSQYTPRCVKIKVGQQVTWTGAFASHPLEAFGGDTPSPIPAFTSADPDGGTLAVVFTPPGTFGFRCGIHTVAMTGAVKVVP